MTGGVPPNERRAALADMRETLVRARMGLDDLRRSGEETRRRIAEESRDVATAERRRALAEGIGDAETAGVATRFITHHQDRLAVLERKLAAQEAEVAMVEGEVTEMLAQFKAAMAGVGSFAASAPDGSEASADSVLGAEAAGAERELDDLKRSQARAAREAAADARLQELKRRMGK
ncbi:MAG: hypothetical protein ACT4R6_10915 [Gemmatimonadaceae bacterium]